MGFYKDPVVRRELESTQTEWYLTASLIGKAANHSLTLSSTISMENSLPSPRALLHVRMLLLLVMRARIVHLDEMEETT